MQVNVNGNYIKTKISVVDQFHFSLQDPDPLNETDPDIDPDSKKLREIHIKAVIIW